MAGDLIVVDPFAGDDELVELCQRIGANLTMIASP
jgi:hypothetical protein